MLIVALVAVSFAFFLARVGLTLLVRETATKILDEWNWEMPGKMETSAEFFRELRGNRDWCAIAAA
jgi:hypothetical protein